MSDSLLLGSIELVEVDFLGLGGAVRIEELVVVTVVWVRSVSLERVVNCEEFCRGKCCVFSFTLAISSQMDGVDEFISVMFINIILNKRRKGHFYCFFFSY